MFLNPFSYCDKFLLSSTLGGVSVFAKESCRATWPNQASFCCLMSAPVRFGRHVPTPLWGETGQAITSTKSGAEEGERGSAVRLQSDTWYRDKYGLTRASWPARLVWQHKLRQIYQGKAMDNTTAKHGDLEFVGSPNWQPAEIAKRRWGMVVLVTEYNVGSTALNSLTMDMYSMYSLTFVTKLILLLS